MNNNMHQNSLFSHNVNKADNVYVKMSDKIINCFNTSNESLTMQDISNMLNVPLNRISGRFGELVRNNKLEIVGTLKPINSKHKYSIYKLIK